MNERIIDFDKISDPEEKAWAMIWKVAPQMEGVRLLNNGDQEIIEEIGRMRSLGKLNDLQIQVLNSIGLNRSLDFEW